MHVRVHTFRGCFGPEPGAPGFIPREASSRAQTGTAAQQGLQQKGVRPNSKKAEHRL